MRSARSDLKETGWTALFLRMRLFVPEGSIVRSIWGKSDTILFIFAGASAEFALNKAVDWLYFTGRLPADPLGRLFSTVSYARRIVFAPEAEALKAIDAITAIHKGVESARGAQIPDWAYRDVLFLLIHYSISAFELLEHKLTPSDRGELYDVFLRIGRRMGLTELPDTYVDWLPVREAHLQADLVRSTYTDDLFRQYRKHLGAFRFAVLKEGQKLVVPQRVKDLLDLNRPSLLTPVVPLYKFSRLLHLDGLVKTALMPAAYRAQVRALDGPGSSH
ncbi:MAG: hypothetical protein JWP27_2711 [Flaviaesturariibacter sp.]|nr:hypothetical protein [Flaviaesturariibacter sp.]